ncbi:MAG: hypothetical protein DRH37_09550 [Deltaproteobacteria bacterium]|nr:MAG: hypothetical protein DRH37_09550 [Deltaproteobacteria bacterium]
MNLSILSKLYLLVTIILAIACESIPEVDTNLNQDSIPEYQLFISDSFGVEIGDSLHMIGSIQNICHHPNGSVLLLDRTVLCLRVVPRNGNAYRILRNGEGPGELLGPQGLCVLGDGRILIPDMYKRQIMTYDEQGAYLGAYYPSDGKPPTQIFPVDSSSIVGIMFDNKMVDEEPQLCYSLDRYNSSIEPSVNYYLLNFEVTGWDESVRAIDALDFYASREGHVYIAKDFTEYKIDVYKPDGMLWYQIENIVERLQKTDEQIQNEIQEYEEFAVNDASYSGGYQPPLYTQLISIIGVDSDGFLWIQRYDFETGYHFDLWDSSGTQVHTAYLPNIATNIEIQFLIDEYGMIGAVVDSDDYPRLYYIDIE